MTTEDKQNFQKKAFSTKKFEKNFTKPKAFYSYLNKNTGRTKGDSKISLKHDNGDTITDENLLYTCSIAKSFHWEQIFPNPWIKHNSKNTPFNKME